MDFIFDDEVDEVGSEVEAFCPKCKADTNHVVMFKYEDEIRKVECKSCGDVHAFRKPRGEVEEEVPEPLAAKKRAAKAKPTWEQVMAKTKKDPKLYMLADRYSENEVISHPIFGVGFVSEIIGTDKMEVTFQNERRVMAHNRKGQSLPPSAYQHVVDATAPRDRKAAMKQAAQKSAAAAAQKKAQAKAAKADAGKGKEAKPARPVARPVAKPAKPAKAARPARPARPAKPAPAPSAKKPAARPNKSKPSRAAAPARSKPAARAAKARPPVKKAKKR
jgi:Zn ribbon nucleic-acid-binding protein